jgi:hypothetical protein
MALNQNGTRGGSSEQHAKAGSQKTQEPRLSSRVFRPRWIEPQAQQLLMEFDEHLNEAGIGTISEMFDAEPPYTPGGRIAQE